MKNNIEDDGNTPLDLDEAADLIPKHIKIKSELDAVEQANILVAELWLSNTKRKDILSIQFILKLHKKMFNQVWQWAGTFRKTDKNIGIEPTKISTQLKQLIDDVNYQIENKTYDIAEIAARFHHRLVYIHPFANGNGRFARLITDKLLTQYNRPRFLWGNTNLQNKSEIRATYINALRAADKGNYKPLFNFLGFSA